jgi:hypothetical protein
MLDLGAIGGDPMKVTSSASLRKGAITAAGFSTGMRRNRSHAFVRSLAGIAAGTARPVISLGRWMIRRGNANSVHLRFSASNGGRSQNPRLLNHGRAPGSRPDRAEHRPNTVNSPLHGCVS